MFRSVSLFPKAGLGCVADEEYPDPPCLLCIPLMYGSYIKGGKVLNEPSLFSINYLKSDESLPEQLRLPASLFIQVGK